MDCLQKELLSIAPSIQILQSCASNNMHITMNQLKLNNKQDLDLAIKVIKQFEAEKHGISDVINLDGFSDFNKKVLFVKTVPSVKKDLFEDIYNDLKNRFVSAGLIQKKGTFSSHITVCKAPQGKNTEIPDQVSTYIKKYEKNNGALGKVKLGELVFCVKRKKEEPTPPILYTIKLD